MLVVNAGGATGLALTALLFSLKHAIVDASFGRLLTIAAGGIVLGLVAKSSSWRVSAVSHWRPRKSAAGT